MIITYPVIGLRLSGHIEGTSDEEIPALECAWFEGELIPYLSISHFDWT